MAFPFASIGALAGQIGQAISQKKQNEAQRKWATEQQTLAWKRNLEQWKRENQYNDPSQQMARLKAAGLNPNLVYGDGAATQSATSPTFKEAEGQFKNPLGELNPLAVANASIAQQQAKSIRLENLRKEYDLGLKKPEHYVTSVEVWDEETGTYVESEVYKTTDSPYYNRIFNTAQKIGYDKDISKFKAKLAESGFTTSDNVFIRTIYLTMMDMGISPSNLTRKILNKVLDKLDITIENE